MVTQAFRGRRRNARRKRTDRVHRTRLRLELLEDRTLLSGGPGALSFQVLATLGDPAPGPGAAGFLINDFEPNGLNNNGQVLFGADLGTTTDPASFVGEGIYLRNTQGQVTRLAGSTDPAPGGGTYDFGFFGPSSLNDQGDVAFSFQLSPFMLPFGVNGGTFRFSHTTQTVTPVVVPFVTPAPGGGTFQGSIFVPWLTNRGDLFFDGIVPTENGIHLSTEPYIGLGEGIFKQDQSGHISSVLGPGDAAPGGGTFDWVAGPSVNDGGDMAFEAHVAGDQPTTLPFFLPQSVNISAVNAVYLKNGGTGTITRIAHYGDAAPGGGTFFGAFGAQINNAGDIIFIGNLTTDYTVDGLFRFSNGVITSIAHPGDAMPGGGHLVTVSGIIGNQAHINAQGDIVFNATLDTNTGGVPDTGLYQWSKGKVSLLARSGTVIPGVGTIEGLVSPSAIIIGPSPGFFPTSGAVSNNRGQVLFSATLTDGRDVLLLATPTGAGNPAVAAATSSATASALTSTSTLRALASSVAGNRANAISNAPAAPAGASDHITLDGAFGAFSSGPLNSTPPSGPASGDSSSHAALDQLFADLVNDTLQNGLAHAGL